MRPAATHDPHALRGDRGRVVPAMRRERSSESPSPLRVSTLPPRDLLEQAAARVGVVAGVVIGVSVIEALISHLWPYFTRADYPTTREQLDLVGNVLVIGASAVVLGIARSRRLATVTRLRVGTGYLLLIAYLVSLTDHADHYWAGGHSPHGVPWVTGLILVFPIIIPMRPLRATVIGLLMAASSPLAMWTHVVLLHYSRPDLKSAVDAFPFLFALVAGYLAKIQQYLGREVGQARQLGAYTLEVQIGRGGMGEVWTASHRFLARPAAIKLVRAELTGVEATTLLERFEREAQATAGLKSPHTVEVYDFGLSDDGRLYYAMELLDGIDLDTLVKRHGAQPAERVVYWLRQICHSLGEAHDLGLVHRDVKPANLFVCCYGRDYDFIKVLDFGVVSLKPSRSEPNPALTATGHVVGSPCCMAPEMATDDHPVDSRSDIYALGCVAYFALTGKQVFCADSAIQVVAAHVTQAPIPPSRLSSAPIPEELERLILACLAKKPAERPSSADEILAWLDRCSFDQAWTQARAHDWWERNAVA